MLVCYYLIVLKLFLFYHWKVFDGKRNLWKYNHVRQWRRNERRTEWWLQTKQTKKSGHWLLRAKTSGLARFGTITFMARHGKLKCNDQPGQSNLDTPKCADLESSPIPSQDITETLKYIDNYLRTQPALSGLFGCEAMMPNQTKRKKERKKEPWRT